MLTYCIIFFILTFAGPLIVYWSGKIDLSADYRTANRQSAMLAPQPDELMDGIVQIYAARTFNWRGIFAVHTWIAVKAPSGLRYTVHQKIGWRILQNLPPVVTQEDIPDRHWFNQKPTIILDLRGGEAERLLEKISAAVASYPFSNQYAYWPGPNSNTFIAYIGRSVPELKLVMPSIAIGKDFFKGKFFMRAISGTGFQFTLYGIFGVTLALREGIEINLLGLVYGLSPWMGTIKLPGLGDIGLKGFKLQNFLSKRK